MFPSPTACTTLTSREKTQQGGKEMAKKPVVRPGRSAEEGHQTQSAARTEAILVELELASFAVPGPDAG
jgi:hypothetical protein